MVLDIRHWRVTSSIIIALALIRCSDMSAQALTDTDVIAGVQPMSRNSFVQIFAGCKISSQDFDECIKNAINSCTPYFKTGVPELDIPPFDPFFASRIVQTRDFANALVPLPISYRLALINVTESGWTLSSVTKFRSDLNKEEVQFTQFFPEKYLMGQYEIFGRLPRASMKNGGTWNLTLYDLVQTTTIRRVTSQNIADGSLKHQLKVSVDVQTIRDLDLHIGNLLLGHSYMESMLHQVMNISWRPFFGIMRSLINDLVSTGFTDIFNRAFNHLELIELIGVDGNEV